MARVVESVVCEYSGIIHREIIITKTLAGAMRHAELSKRLGRPMPVPAIVIDGELAFDAIPGEEQLRWYLAQCIEAGADRKEFGGEGG